jgi:hypothetical protein
MEVSFVLKGCSRCAGIRLQWFWVLTSRKGDRLWIADPKALHYILQATSYLYVKPSISREISYMIADEGLLWADGTVGPHLPPTRTHSTPR